MAKLQDTVNAANKVSIFCRVGINKIRLVIAPLVVGVVGNAEFDS